MSVRRYAEGTTVSVDASRGEITGILAKHGVQRMGWMADVDRDELMFELGGGSYRLTMVKPTLTEIRKLYPTLEQVIAAGGLPMLTAGTA